MDTTTAIVLVLGAIMIIRLLTLCKHDWQVLHETRGKSRVESMKELLGGVSGEQGIAPSNFAKCDTVIVSCKKCGQLRRFKNVVVPG